MNDDKRRALAHDALTRHIAAHRLRATPERFAVLDRMLDLPSRFTIEQLREAVDSSDFHVSRATVYNSVGIFADAGIIRRLAMAPDTWEIISDRQAPVVRLVCRKCGKVRDVRDPQMMRTLSLRRYPAFVVSGIEVCISGFCSRCKPKEKKN